MKTLTMEQMELTQAGMKAACGLALIGLAGSIAGGLIGLATLNPIGIGLGIVGIYTGLPGAIFSCSE